MRIARAALAAVLWLLATALFVVAAVLSITIVLLPIGVPLLLLAFRLYGYGVQLMMPRPSEVKKRAGKGFEAQKDTAVDAAKGARTRARGALRGAGKATKGPRRKLGKAGRSAGLRPKGIRGRVRGWTRGSRRLLPG